MLKRFILTDGAIKFTQPLELEKIKHRWIVIKNFFRKPLNKYTASLRLALTAGAIKLAQRTRLRIIRLKRGVCKFRGSGDKKNIQRILYYAA